MGMLRTFSVSILITLAFTCLSSATAVAQRDAAAEAFDSPIKLESRPFDAGPTIACSLALPPNAALFGTDKIQGTSDLVTNELFSPFRVFRYDQQCALVSSWATQSAAGVTSTGIAISATGTDYWNVDFANAVIVEYSLGSGVPTGRSVPLPTGLLVIGPIIVDDHQPGEVLCMEDIALDVVACVDVIAGGPPLCSIAMGGTFGNGLSDAVFPDDCSGKTLLASSGTITEGQVARVGQFDCSGTDPACTQRWDLTPAGSTFVNGIAEFASTTPGGRSLMAIDNVTSTVLRLDDPSDLRSCQGGDPDMQILFVNGSSGDTNFRVDVAVANTLSVGVQRPPAGNGRFVHHMNVGEPRRTTVTPLLDLGDACFSFQSGSAVVVENNVGKTNVIGASNYFGTPIPDPGKAPTFLGSLSQPQIDVVNLSAGAMFTHQIVAKNAASSSARGASLSNAVLMTMR